MILWSTSLPTRGMPSHDRGDRLTPRSALPQVEGGEADGVHVYHYTLPPSSSFTFKISASILSTICTPANNSRNVAIQYVVLGVEHPGDAFASVASGRVIPFDDAAWQQAKATPEGAVAYQVAQVVVRSADLRFVINRLREQPLPLGIDVERTRVGVFGHSLGGMAAAGVCAAEPVVACANLDADYEGLPWLRDAGPPTRPFLFFATPHSLYESPALSVPTDDELVKMKMTREAYNAEAHKNQAAQDAAMAGLTVGHRIAVETPTSRTAASWTSGSRSRGRRRGAPPCARKSCVQQALHSRILRYLLDGQARPRARRNLARSARAERTLPRLVIRDQDCARPHRTFIPRMPAYAIALFGIDAKRLKRTAAC